MNVVLIIILIAVVVLAAGSGAKHFKGQGGCCGGGGELRPEHKKLDGPVAEEKIISIDGMSCENCRNRVERAINKIDGASARVNLRKKEAVLFRSTEKLTTKRSKTLLNRQATRLFP